MKDTIELPQYISVLACDLEPGDMLCFPPERVLILSIVYEQKHFILLRVLWRSGVRELRYLCDTQVKLYV
jgi:hypothetical protein